MVVFSRASDGPYAALADDIAHDRDELLTNSLSDIDDADEVLLVDAPDAIRPDDIQAILTRFIESEPYSLNFGIITGRTPDEARSLYFTRSQRSEPVTDESPATSRSSSSNHQRHCVAVPDANASIGTNDPDTTLVTDEAVSQAKLTALAESGLDSFSAVLHGSHMFSRLADGLLSGYPTSLADDAFDGNQPPFVDSETNAELIESDTIRAEALDIPAVFLDGCSALPQNMNNGKDDPVHVALSLLANAESLIGTYRITECIDHHGPLHHNLYRAGYSASDRAYLLNRSAATSGLDPYPYIVAGLPEHQPSPANTLPKEYTTAINPGDNRCTVTVTDVDTPIIDVRVPAENFDSAVDSFAVRRVDGPNHPLFYTAFREGADIRLIIHSWGVIRANRFEFEISPHRTIHESRSRLAALVDDNLDSTEIARIATLTDAVPQAVEGLWTGLPEETTRRCMNECQSALRRANQKAAEERYTVNAYQETLEILSEASAHLDRARTNLLEHIRTREADSIQDLYFPRTDTATPQTQMDCPYCESTAYQRVRQDQFSQTKRVLGICANCAYLYDAPVLDDESTVAYPRFRGDTHNINGTSQTYTVEFENPLDRPTQARVRLSIEQLADNDVINDPARDIVLEPNETATMEFSVDIQALKEHLQAEWEQNTDLSIEPHYEKFGPAFAEIGPDTVHAALEELAATDPEALNNDPVTVDVDGSEITVDPEMFEVNREDRSRSLATLSGHFVLEALIALDSLDVYSGTRTLYPQLE
jgi:hypothetical protein